MSKPNGFRGKKMLECKAQAQRFKCVAKESNLLVFVAAFVIFAIMISLWNEQTTSYAHAYVGEAIKSIKKTPPLLETNNNLFEKKNEFATISKISENIVMVDKSKGKDSSFDAKKESEKFFIESKKANSAKMAQKELTSSSKQKKFDLVEEGNSAKLGKIVLNDNKKNFVQDKELQQFTQKLYDIVGETPIKEMIPFISQRDEKVAAFLVGIAKKESSFGLASPLKDGETCYNYWGYKGSGGRGVGMGYACFASAEEAIKTVGDRIEVLVNKDRNTPARMVDTWKCGTSCAGDPGAPGWTSTVALYFNQIVKTANKEG
ncbi:MAG: hypothetical protein UR99_C0052G0005 [Candidatus Moranbacteria bacterium GW2011_GWD2_36_12]|nr:MAG: hypothetical protein UR99_C0052G0005 [Candidatus Moranbacteria bacterium GW2011_GWD2_36_12]KKQ04606.1 MAG: hypothetical protein US16_C0053G0005 [Candidatus Moranbacteria bacterium GW2011_GWE2_36_40]